jgi:signal transduction histidine kinase
VEDQGIARIKEIKKHLTFQSGEKAHNSLLFKPLRNTKSNIEKKFLNVLKNDKSNSISEKITLRNEMRNILLNIDELRSLPNQILSLNYFQLFECCHILVHEKGKPEGQNFYFHYNIEEHSKAISIQSFNNIYNLVKKSKNKIFNQAMNFKDDLDLVGNFLAKEVDLKNHSVVCLISRNSFLPPSAEEQDHFFVLCSFLVPLLNKLLDREKNDFKKDVLIKSLKHFPEKIYILDNQRVIFSNDKNVTKKEGLNLISFPLGGTDGLTMELSNLAKDTISTDIYHSQRISLLGELLNTLQHELSNPLFGLSLTSSLLKTEVSDPEVIETLDDICQNAARSQTIIKNFSNLYNDQQEFKNTNLINLIEETLTLTKSESKEIRKFIECRNFSKNDGIWINTNPTYLTQIIFNLIINAAQAIKTTSTSPGKHQIVISVIDDLDFVKIEVSDDGPGIKNEFENDIFRPFFTTKDAGTGLGLSICKNLAISLGAEIIFKNNSPLPGATFSLNLPKII